MAQHRVEDTEDRTPDGTISAASPNTGGSSFHGQAADSAQGRRATGNPDELRLPESYGVERIALMCQDPFTLYCYWELQSGSLYRCRPQIADGGRWALNVQPEGCNPYDIDVAVDQGACYVSLKRGGGAYVVVLGIRNGTGEFLPLLRSNRLVLPPPTVSDVEDESWSGGAEFDARAFAAALSPHSGEGRASVELPNGPSSLHSFGPRFHNWSSFLLAKKNTA